MYVMNSKCTRIVNLDKCAEVFIRQTLDNVLLSCRYDNGEIETIERFAYMEEAVQQLQLIVDELHREGKNTFMLEPTAGIVRTEKIHDARTKRKGKSLEV